MSRRNGTGPTRERDGATVKVTLRGDRDLCWLHGCTRVPARVITFHGKRVWVCEPDAANDGVTSGWDGSS